jgi:hypothetical protein
MPDNTLPGMTEPETQEGGCMPLVIAVAFIITLTLPILLTTVYGLK